MRSASANLFRCHHSVPAKSGTVGTRETRMKYCRLRRSSLDNRMLIAEIISSLYVKRAVGYIPKFHRAASMKVREANLRRDQSVCYRETEISPESRNDCFNSARLIIRRLRGDEAPYNAA